MTVWDLLTMTMLGLPHVGGRFSGKKRVEGWRGERGAEPDIDRVADMGLMFHWPEIGALIRWPQKGWITLSNGCEEGGIVCKKNQERENKALSDPKDGFLGQIFQLGANQVAPNRVE